MIDFNDIDDMEENNIPFMSFIGKHKSKTFGLVGNRVRIKKGSEYYGYDSAANPRIDGSLIDGSTLDNNDIVNDYDHYLRVRWDNGYTNSYKLSDLEYIN